MIWRRWLRVGGVLVAAAALTLAAAACKGGQTAGSGGSAESIKVNLDEIFPQGPGRDLVLENCQNCHTFVPIVVLQMDKDAWHRNSLDHRERVTTLTDEQFKTVYKTRTGTTEVRICIHNKDALILRCVQTLPRKGLLHLREFFTCPG